MNELVQVVYTKKHDKLIMRQHVGEGTYKDINFKLSTGVNGLGIFLEVKDSMIAVDADKFIKYAIDNFDELVDNYDNNIVSE